MGKTHNDMTVTKKVDKGGETFVTFTLELMEEDFHRVRFFWLKTSQNESRKRSGGYKEKEQTCDFTYGSSRNNWKS